MFTRSFGRGLTAGLMATGAGLGALAAIWWARSHGQTSGTPSSETPPQVLTTPAWVPSTEALVLLDRSSLVAFEDRPERAEAALPERSASRSFEGDEAELTAVPQGSSHRMASADDYEAIGSDELGAAFLARATDSLNGVDEDLDGEDEMPGFQITTLASLLTPELSDDGIELDWPASTVRYGV